MLKMCILPTRSKTKGENVNEFEMFQDMSLISNPKK